MQLFDVTYGYNLLDELENEIKDKSVIFVTQHNLFDKYIHSIPSRYHIVFIDTMEEEELRKLNVKLPDFDVSIGFGGGMSIDAGKYFAYMNNKTCYLMPTAISVDACFSYPVAVRHNNKVKYIGKCIGKKIYVDYDIIRNAPLILNLSGVGDVMSCYTGLFDWEIMARDVEGITIIESIRDRAEEYLKQLFDSSDDIRNVTDKGIKLIMDAYKWVGETGYNNGFCYYEEGSEHYFAYAVESVNGKHLLHGQLVCLGIYIMSKFQQEGRQKKIIEYLDKLGLSISLSSIGIDVDDVVKALRKLNRYVVEENLAYSILNRKMITEEFIKEALSEIESFR